MEEIFEPEPEILRPVKYLATCSYIGMNYSGFQTQILNGKRIPSIQDALQDALKKIAKHDTPIHTSSRTDQGVNALAHPFVFIINRNQNQKILEPSIIKKSMNMHLKDAKHQISIENIYYVHPTDFDVKANSLKKEYNYFIEANLKDNWANTFQQHKQVTTMTERIDQEKLNQALQQYVGTHNFQNFTIKAEHISHFGCYVRTIDSITIENYSHPFYEDAQCIKIIFKAKSFLAYQIRFMVGEALQYAMGKLDFESFLKLLDPPKELTPQEVHENNRIRAQPRGLMLKRVDYPPEMLSSNLKDFYPQYC
ncbi:hypothetical protein ABPG74_006427 [Tetrahymena malaccensis]